MDGAVGKLGWNASTGSRRGERLTIAALLAAFWLFFQVIFFTYGTLAHGGDGISPGALVRGIAAYLASPVEIAIVAVGATLSLSIYLVLRRLRGMALWLQLCCAMIAALGCAAVFSAAVSILCDLFGVPWPAITARFLVTDSIRWLAPFGLWAGIALAVTYNSEVRERERRLALIEAHARDAQMRALRYQVNPHLLYNTLNSIAALILDRKNDLAEAMVMRLSDFFRASLSNDPGSDVPLAEEVALQRIYLEIEQMRFPGLHAEFLVPGDVADLPVPSLILQPLVENVLKHGVHADGSPTRLRIGAARRGRMLEIEVSDDGPGTSEVPGTGVGLRNVAGRLQSRFGDLARLETESRPGEGFRVRVTIPVGP